MKKPLIKNNRVIKALVLLLGFLIIVLIVYLVFLPLYPELRYKYINYENKKNGVDPQNLAQVASQNENILKTADHNQKETGNRLVISKIGVDAPIVESKNQDYALSKGIWHLPETGTPGKIGNTVLSGHRFKYLPPSNLTLYLLDKLEKGDIVSLVWQNKNYYYRVSDKKIVSADDQSILAASDKPILTLFTCDPIYSEKNRLVVIGELIEQ